MTAESAGPDPLEARKSALCLDCGLCCRVVLAYFPVFKSVVRQEETRVWREARGIWRAPNRDLPGLEAWMVPSVCPQLDRETNRCGIYSTRPEVCRNFDGRTAPEIECKWQTDL